jgi:transcriptional regulator with XRE-family HTH domain
MSSRDSVPLPDYLRVSIGAVVRAWRLARGFTLEELAVKAGPDVSRGYLSQLENDKIHTPSEEKLAQLAEALGIAPLVLVTRTFPDTELPNTLPAAVADSTAPIGIEGAAAPHFDVDLSRLTAALSRVPTSRQQQYVDAFVALVEQLTEGEAQERV